MAAVGPAKHNSFVDGASTRVERLVQWFAVFKHVLCAMYLGVQAFVLFSLSSVDVAATRAFAPRVIAMAFSTMALMHLRYAIGSCCRRRHVGRTISVESFDVSLRPSRTWRDKVVHRLAKATHVSEDAISVAFTTFELVCQSYQAIQVAEYVVARSFVVVYVVVVAVHCILSPWLLVAPSHVPAKHFLLNWSNSVFSFGLTCLLPLLGLLLPVLQYLIVDSTLGSDPVWSTHVLLFSRIAVVSSPVGFLVKVTIDVGTLVSLRRLDGVLTRASGRRSRPRHAPNAPSWMLWLYVVLCAAWGVVLGALCIQGMLFRQSCPPYCIVSTTPLFDRSCQCRYLHMDCHTLHNASLDVDDVLDPATIGSALFILQVSRCDIPNGISNTSLARQPGLFAITLQFTKMHSWPGTLPPTTASIVLRQCAFSTIPAILEKVLPATMRILIVESTPLASLPLQISRLWHPLASLQLINTSLRELPMAITSLANLNSLSLFNNRIQHVPVAWQSQLNALPNFRSLNLAANDLTELPTMLRTDIDVDLSLNPIGSLPQGLDLNRLLKLKLSHTSYCNETYPSPPSICAASACAHACQFSMVGDRNCDVGCFNAACDFDGTDCKEYGLEPP